MKQFIYILVFWTFSTTLFSQNLYFPPIIGNTWETVTPTSLGWCTDKLDSLSSFLQRTNTKGFMVLKDGKIAIEWYYGTFTRDSNWYWASAGKTLTALTVGIAQQERLLKIQDTSSKFLGRGWTSLTATQEDKIKISHQLTMTTGLDDATNADCTDPQCLLFKADAGTRWAYHNGAYTLLDKVVENASGTNFNAFVQSRIRSKIGMNGTFLKIGYNNINFSTVRSMARFGLLLLNKGTWNTTPILTDTSFFRQMTTTSQHLNMSYGYLTWLNGKSSYMVPSLQRVLNGSLTPNAPTDMYSALGKNGQIIHVVPSQNLVVIRMGDAPDDVLVPIVYPIEIWQRLNPILCNRTAVQNAPDTEGVILSPNPVFDVLNLDFQKNQPPQYLRIFDATGRLVLEQKNVFNSLTVNKLNAGTYFLKGYFSDGKTVLRRFVKQ